MTEEQAKKVVTSIIDDLSDRRGLGHAWYMIDDDIREEIEREWVKIVMNVCDDCNA